MRFELVHLSKQSSCKECYTCSDTLSNIKSLSRNPTEDVRQLKLVTFAHYPYIAHYLLRPKLETTLVLCTTTGLLVWVTPHAVNYHMILEETMAKFKNKGHGVNTD